MNKLARLAPRLAAALLLLALGRGASAQVAFVNASDLGSNVGGAAAATFSHSYTVNHPGEVLRVALVDFSAPQGQSFTATFYGAPMVPECGPTGRNSAGVAYSFYLLDPRVATASIVLTAAVSTRVAWTAADYTAVGAFGGCTSGQGAPSDSTQVSTGVNGAWVSSFATASGGVGPGAGLTGRASDGSSGQSLWALSDSGAIASPTSSALGNAATAATVTSVLGQSGVASPLVTGPLVYDLLAVYYPAALGTPQTLSWANLDPNGAVVFTAPRAVVVQAATLTTKVPTGVAPSLLDLYVVPSGTPCLSPAGAPNGVKLHGGDLNADPATAGSVQFAQLAPSAVTVVGGSSVCVDSQEPFPATGTATVTVTVL